MDDDIAELLGITMTIEAGASGAQDVTSREWLASIDPWARYLAEHSGYGYEEAVVLCQQWQTYANEAAAEWDRVMGQVRAVYETTATAVNTMVANILEAFGPIAELAAQAEEPPPLRRCPTHGELLTKGGSCRRCQFGQGRWARDAERRHQQVLRRVRR
jgi:hypothetical protein